MPAHAAVKRSLPDSRHQINIARPSGIVNDFTGVNPSWRAAASTFDRVIFAVRRRIAYDERVLRAR